MRTRVFALLVAAFCLAPLAGCGDDSVADNDLSVVHDLSVASGDTCLQVITCAAGCAGAAPCQTACAAKGSTKAQGQYQALFGCAYGRCTVANDGGAAACTSATDTAAGCTACASAAGQSPACSTQLIACTSGM